MRALILLKDRKGTIYTDSKYAYGVVHTFGKIWEERGLINSQGKGLVHEYLIKQTLQALRNPKQIAIVHRRGHQKGKSDHIRGNNLADEEAKKAALLIVKELGIGESKEQKQYEKGFLLRKRKGCCKWVLKKRMGSGYFLMVGKSYQKDSPGG